MIKEEKPTVKPLYMKAFPQLTGKTNLALWQTDAKTFRILFDGNVHPLFVGYKDIKEADETFMRLDFLRSMAAEWERDSGTDSEPHKFGHSLSEFIEAASKGTEAWEKLFVDN